MTTKLKPCPFCGNKYIQHDAEDGSKDEPDTIWCGDCGCMGPSHQRRHKPPGYSAIAAWNSRAPARADLGRIDYKEATDDHQK